MSSVIIVAVILYAAFLLFYVLWGFFLIYHLFRFSPHRVGAVAASVLFLAVTAFLLLVSFAFFARVDWQAPLTFVRPTY